MLIAQNVCPLNFLVIVFNMNFCMCTMKCRHDIVWIITSPFVTLNFSIKTIYRLRLVLAGL